MSDALKLANEYRPTMTGDVLHSWAVDAVGALHRQDDEIERLRAQVAALSAPAPAPAEAALKQARWEGIQSVQIQTAEIVRAALELLDAAGDTFPPERLAAFQRVFGGAAPAAPAGWQLVQLPVIECTCPAKNMPFGRCCKVPPERETDKWESCRVADFNAGWNACRSAMLAAAPGAQGDAS